MPAAVRRIRPLAAVADHPARAIDMTYVITDRCADTKDMSCVEVCPVNCIHPTFGEPGFDAASQVYINPEECIDCNACLEVCPVDAPVPEDSLTLEELPALALNARHFR